MTTERLIAPTAHETPTVTATVRGWTRLLVVVGIMGLVSPLWPLGAVLVVVGLWNWAGSHVVEPIEAAAAAETETSGGGCGLWLSAVFVVVVIGGGLLILFASALGGV